MNGVIVVTNTDRDEAKTLLEDTWRNFQLDYESSLFRFVRRAWRERNQEEKWPRGILEREVQDFARPFFSRGFQRIADDGQSEWETTRSQLNYFFLSDADIYL